MRMHINYHISLQRFAVEEKLEPFYTGGQVQISSDGAHMFCQCESAVKILQLEKLTVVQSLEEVSVSFFIV